jgi:phosphatidylglycerol---prolipoprotein diacylglyceryl transferase
MHPVLFELPWGGHANAYGTLILIGTITTMPGVWWDAKRRGVGSPEFLSFLVDFYLAIALGAYVGGRLLHVLTVPAQYVADPSRVFVSDGTGFVFFGSLAAIVASWVWIARRHRTPFATVCDLAATWLPLGHGFGRLGCYFAGCCWGAPTQSSLGVRFGPDAIVTLVGGAPLQDDHTVPLLPVQALEAGGLFVIAAVLIGLRVRRGPEPRWLQASRYAAAYGGLRFVMEAMRGDTTRGFVFEIPGGSLAQWLGMAPSQPLVLSWSQVVAAGLVALGAFGWRRGLRAQRP